MYLSSLFCSFDLAAAVRYHVSLKPKIRVGFEAKLGNSSSSER